MPLGQVARCHLCHVLANESELVLDKSVNPYDYKCLSIRPCEDRQREKLARQSKRLVFRGKRVPKPPSPWTQYNIWLTVDERSTLQDLLPIPASTWIRDRINELFQLHGKPPLFPKRICRKRSAKAIANRRKKSGV